MSVSQTAPCGATVTAETNFALGGKYAAHLESCPACKAAVDKLRKERGGK